MHHENIADLLLIAVVVLAVAFLASWTIADPDLWGHVRFGLDILAEGAIPREDPYSFTSDLPWINHEWLSEVTMAGAYRAAGPAGLIGLKWLITGVTLALVWRAIRIAGVRRPAAAVLLLLAGLGAFGLIMTVRPQLFSMLLFVLELSVLNEAGRGRRQALLWMPMLFAVWANVHGGWMVGLGVLGLWSAGMLLSRAMPWPWAAGITALSALGTLITPYAFDLWRFLWETVGLDRADITEWQPLTYAPVLLVPWTAAAGLVVLAFWRRRWPALPLLVPALALAILSFRVSRLDGFFALASVVLLASPFAGMGPESLPLSRRPTRSELALVIVMFAGGAAAAGLRAGEWAGCLTIPGPMEADDWAPEAESVAFLQQTPLRGRLLTYFPYGELAIWHFTPRLVVSYDGRRETVYSERVRQAHIDFYSESPDVSYPDRIGADYIWIPRRLAAVGPLTAAGWVTIFDGTQSVVLARRNGGPYVQPPPWTGPRCFPGP
jgi:hypothetical protein